MRTLSTSVSVTIEEAKAELLRTVEKTQVLVTILGASLQLPFILNDYLLLPENWQQILFLRILVFVVPVAITIFRKKLKINASTCMFFVALAISLLDAYIGNIVSEVQFKSFSIGYVVLFIGIGMLAVWEIVYSLILIGISLFVNIILFILYSPISVKDYLVDGEISIFVVAIISILMVNVRYNLNVNEIKARMELEKSKKIIQDQQEDILSSIRYGQRIQEALLKQEDDLNGVISDHFILYKPKDIVSGDFYWTARKNEYLYVAVGDCTGHGVPGAFITMFATSFLNEFVSHSVEILKPNEILEALRSKVINDISNNSINSGISDGMDISIIRINTLNGECNWSGANNPIWLTGNFKSLPIESPKIVIRQIEKSQLTEIIGDKQPIGIFERMKPFTDASFSLSKGQMIYLFSDGYSDQFGGSKAKKLRAKTMQEIVCRISHLPCDQQSIELETEHEKWKGNYEQVDDICVFGLRF